jgi:hypothetical protein
MAVPSLPLYAYGSGLGEPPDVLPPIPECAMKRLSLLLLLLGAAPASAQITLSYVTSFTHSLFAGNGTIGVCTDSFTGDIWVVDFSNTINLHRFDIAGNLLSSHPTNVCTPSMTSPNDVTQNRGDGTLWLVDNDSPGRVLQMSTGGTCLGGFTLGSAYLNPVSITYNMLTADLRIGHTGSVAAWSTAGVNLNNNFTPATGASIVSGLTHMPGVDRYLAATGTSVLTEMTATGGFVATHVLSPAPVNIQAVDYDPLSGRVVVADNSTVTIYVFQDTTFSALYQTNQAQANLTVNGMQGSTSQAATVMLGLGQPGVIAFGGSLVGNPFEILVGLAPLVPVGNGALIAPDGQILNIDLTDPTLVVIYNLFQSPPFSPFSIPFSFPSPVAFSLQAAIIDPMALAGLRLTQPVRVMVN